MLFFLQLNAIFLLFPCMVYYRENEKKTARFERSFLCVEKCFGLNFVYFLPYFLDAFHMTLHLWRIVLVQRF